MIGGGACPRVGAGLGKLCNDMKHAPMLLDGGRAGVRHQCDSEVSRGSEPSQSWWTCRRPRHAGFMRCQAGGAWRVWSPTLRSAGNGIGEQCLWPLEQGSWDAMKDDAFWGGDMSQWQDQNDEAPPAALTALVVSWASTCFASPPVLPVRPSPRGHDAPTALLHVIGRFHRGARRVSYTRLHSQTTRTP